MHTNAFLFAGLVFSCSVFANTPPATQSPSGTLLTERLAAQKAYLQRINQCNSPKRLSNLMLKALTEVDNDAARAKHASLFEEIMLNNPSCAMLAINEMPSKQCAQFEAHFVRETFFIPRDQIKASLSRVVNAEKSCMALS